MNDIGQKLDEVFGSQITLWIANRKVRNLLDDLRNEDPILFYSSDKRTRVSKEQLLHYLEQEQERLKGIEDKAKTNILGITLAFAGMALVTSQSTTNISSENWIFWVMVSGFVFLLRGGVLALGVLRIGERFVWTLEDEAEVNATDEAKAMKILWHTELNQTINRLKANEIYASHSCIRNGILLLAIAVFFAANYWL